MNLGELTPDLKVLIDAEIESAVPPGTLPSPTDEGDVLTVVSGDWAGAPSGGSQPVRQTALLTLTADDLNNLASSPFELVAAPDAGKIIVPYLLTSVYTPGNIGYVTLGDYYFFWGTVDATSNHSGVTVFGGMELGLTSILTLKELIFEHAFISPVDPTSIDGQPLNFTSAADSAGQQAISAAGLAVNAPGAGYVVDDVVTVSGGNGDGKLRVASVDGSGHVTGLSLASSFTTPGAYDPSTAPFLSCGSGYSTGTNIATSGGSGDTNLTVDIGAVGDGDGTFDLVLSYGIVDLP